MVGRRSRALGRANNKATKGWRHAGDKYIWRLGQIQFGKTHVLIRKQQKNEDSSYQLPGGALLTSSLQIWRKYSEIFCTSCKKGDKVWQTPPEAILKYIVTSTHSVDCRLRKWDIMNCYNILCLFCHFLTSYSSIYTQCNIVAGLLQWNSNSIENLRFGIILLTVI